jgi:hypothetical protein
VTDLNEIETILRRFEPPWPKTDAAHDYLLTTCHALVERCRRAEAVAEMAHDYASCWEHGGHLDWCEACRKQAEWESRRAETLAAYDAGKDGGR